MGRTEQVKIIAGQTKTAD
ncbi:hypothetical protein OYC64_004889 [Pagothenia borchgrevinki]|uniref:Uncharacterized protein n=1 Tax=Pagothenia borchgrevinki TaxID=8213 RepID=A0ABD2GDM8_PAGBO